MPPAMFCPNCGKQNDDVAKYCQACGLAFQAASPARTVAASTATVTAGTYAGFWVRFVAFVIDACIIALAGGIAAAGTMGVGVVVSFFGPWLYEAFMLSSEWQATVGKRAMSIVVTGMVLTPPRGVCRPSTCVPAAGSAARAAGRSSTSSGTPACPSGWRCSP